jgi:hypothetical protein
MNRDTPAETDQPTTQVIHSAPLVDGTHVLCQTYGHSWEVTEHPDVKECKLCHIRGFCPACTPIPPPNAHPFYCTRHTRHLRT